jgi:hypothetical protein
MRRLGLSYIEVNMEEPFGSKTIDQLTKDEARHVLERFLELGREALLYHVPDWAPLDYSRVSQIRLWDKYVERIRAQQLTDEDKDILFVRLGYYFGESLLRANPKLTWGTADPEFAHANQPVILGFPHKIEAAVVIIATNCILSVAEGRSPPDRTERGINYWFDEAMKVL